MGLRSQRWPCLPTAVCGSLVGGAPTHASPQALLPGTVENQSWPLGSHTLALSSWTVPLSISLVPELVWGVFVKTQMTLMGWRHANSKKSVTESERRVSWPWRPAPQRGVSGSCSLRQTAGLVFPRGGRRAEAGLGPRVVGRMLLSAAPAFLSRRVRVSTLFGRKCKVCPRAAFSDYSPASVLGLEPLQPGPGTGTRAGPPQHVCTPARPLRPATAPPGASRTPGRLHLRSATLQY